VPRWTGVSDSGSDRKKDKKKKKKKSKSKSSDSSDSDKYDIKKKVGSDSKGNHEQNYDDFEEYDYGEEQIN